MSLTLSRRAWRRVLLTLLVLPVALSLRAAEARRCFDLPVGDAAVTLARFAEQADREIVFSPPDPDSRWIGVQTRFQPSRSTNPFRPCTL